MPSVNPDRGRIVAEIACIFEIFAIINCPSRFDYVISVEARTFLGAQRKARSARTLKGVSYSLVMG